MNADKYKKLEKIVVSAGIGKLMTQSGATDKLLPELEKDFTLITGQKPSYQTAKKSIAGFKLREGNIIGLKSTLRGKRMILFLEKLIKIVFPRTRDFRGVSLKSVDERGNLNIGIKENIVFPEINPEFSKASFGVGITIILKQINNKEVALKYYRDLGIPFRKI